MKETWLFAGVIFLMSCWIPSSWLFLLYAIAITVFYIRHFRVHILFFLFLLLMVLPWIHPDEAVLPIGKQLVVREIRSSYLIADNGEQRVIVYGVDKAGFQDVLYVQGDYERVDTIHNIDAFNFRDWLARRHIYYQINVRSVQLLHEGNTLRHQLYERVNKVDNKDAAEWVRSMLFGIHEEDVSYFITSSGLHISFLFLLIEKQLRRKLTKHTVDFILLFLLGFLGNVTVFSSTLLRLLCFRVVRIVCVQYTQKDQLGISILLCLVLFPYMAYEMAFLLPVSFRLLQLFQITKRRRIIMSLTVMIPVQFQYFHSCNPVQIVLFRPLRMIYAILYVCAWLYVLMPLDFLYTCSLYIMHVLQMFETIGFTIHYTPDAIWLILWVYALMKYISYHKARILPLCLMLLYAPFASYLDPFGEILMLDVGQGDCTLVILPFHQGVMLIDVMGSLYKNVPADIIVPVLQAKGITSIDKVIITHADYDHSGGLKELQKLMEVKEVICEKQNDTWLGPLHIPFVLSDNEGSDENENSIITYMEVYGLRMLFMGDAGYEAEEKVMEDYPKLRVDVLKAGHHGSKTSSSPAFLHQLNPQVALMSAGRKNRYGHPSEETLQRMKQEDILPLVTSWNGAVSIKFCKYFAFFRTADNEFGIIKNR